MLTEVIFSLFITILVLSILQNLLLSIKKASMSENQHVNDVAYAYIQLNNFMHAENTKMSIQSQKMLKVIEQLLFELIKIVKKKCIRLNII